MKEYEEETKQKLDTDKPIIIRLGGADFINFTKGLSKPYEEWLHDAFVETTAFLVQEFGASIGYTQSDEISLLFSRDCDALSLSSSNRPLKQEPIQKIVSVLSSATTSFFASRIKKFLESGKINKELYKEDVLEKI